MKVKKLPTIERYKGDTFPIVFNIKEPVKCQEPAVATNITGWAFTLSVSAKHNPTEAGDVLDSIGGVITDAANGAVEFTPGTVLEPGQYFYDIRSTNDQGHIRTQGEGKMVIHSTINQS